EAARKTGEELVAAGYHAQIARTGKEINLFWHREVREALRLAADGTFRLAESGREIQAQELLQKLRERPEDASPGVLLRPLIEDAVGAFDPSLQAAAKTAAGRVDHEGQVLEKKLMQVWKRRHEETANKIRRARERLFPRGNLQERTMSVLGYAAEHGPSLFEE